jgi:hypothetical protein
VLKLYNDPDLRNEMSRAALWRVQSMGGWNEYGKLAARFYSEHLDTNHTSSYANPIVR